MTSRCLVIQFGLKTLLVKFNFGFLNTNCIINMSKNLHTMKIFAYFLSVEGTYYELLIMKTSDQPETAVMLLIRKNAFKIKSE